MLKRICSMVISVLIGVVMPSISAGAHSTTVRYTSTISSYYELTVPLIMVPGETATVLATGTWDSQTALEVTADESVTLIHEDANDEFDLDISFDGICEQGNNSSIINVSADITVENVESEVVGTWEGTFDYYVGFVDDFVNATQHSGIIPEGGIYYVAATEDENALGDYSNAEAVYVAGEEFPEKMSSGDVYVYGDYEYRYQCGYEDVWFKDYINYNWGVTVIDRTKPQYGNMLSSINDKPVDNLIGVFSGCTNMKVSPKLPDCGRLMIWSFYNCTNLIEAPTIPSGVTTLLNAFQYCASLKTAPIIPAAVEDLENSFNGCTSLTGTIEINCTYLMSSFNALKDTQITEITGGAPDDLKDTILATR